MSVIVDTHAHLCDPLFDPDRAEVIERAVAAGVSSVIIVGETLVDARRNTDLAALYPSLRPAAGLYPSHLDLSHAGQVASFIRRERDRLVAIGEVGLDFWVVKNEAQREIQQEIFRGFIELAREVDLPLNVHSRSAGRQAVAMLLDLGARRVQLHAFDAKVGSALPAVEAGYLFSIPPSVVRSRQKEKLVKALPLSSLLVESDSPVLGPSPGERNEPANVMVALQAIAEIKNVRREEVLEAVSRNTERLYGAVRRGNGHPG
jgi:TatD DNase family protein